MILFIYGEDTYRSLQKIEKLRARFFSSSNARLNFLEVDAEDDDLDKALDAIKTPPFLANKRLVIIKNLLSGGKKDQRDKIEKIIDKKIPESTICVFYERGLPDRRTVLYRLLSKNKKEEYGLIEGAELARWVLSEIQKYGVSIGQDAMQELLKRVGNDLWLLSSEISKLANYVGKGEIRMKHIDELVAPKIDEKIFGLLDALASRDLNLAQKFLKNQFEMGVDIYLILGSIYKQFGNMLLMMQMKKEKYNSANMKTKIKLHPFVFRKLGGLIRGFGLGELKRIYLQLLKLDFDIKTGQKDPKMALDLFVFDLCNEKA